jgi:Spy/CpxP family protein refolding chaperone
MSGKENCPLVFLSLRVWWIERGIWPLIISPGLTATTKEKMMKALSRSGWKTGVLLMLATLVMVFAAAALAQGPGGRYGHGMGKGSGAGIFGPEHRLEVLAEKLELTEEQVAAIEGIRESGREKGIELHKEMMRLQNDLEGELLKDEPNEKSALNLVDKIGALRTEIQAQRMKGRLDMRQQLTPEQRDKMLMMSDRFQGGRHGRGGGRGMGPHGDRECDGSGPCRGRRGAARSQ